MPDLTGPFDVCVQIGVRALNRALAAQHRVTAPEDEIYPHSLATRVDDALLGLRGDLETTVSRPWVTLEEPGPAPGPVEPGGTIVVRGRAVVVIHFIVMSRYVADAGSGPAPAEAHGELQLRVEVSELFSPRGDLLDVDLTSPDVGVAFVPGADLSLGSDEIQQVERVLRSILGSLDPVSAVMPSPPGVTDMRFKVLPGSPAIVALLWKLGEADVGAGAEDGARRRFLLDENGLAMAISGEFLTRTLLAAMPAAEPIAGPLGYRFTVGDPSLRLDSGEAEFIIEGQAEGVVGASFTIRQRIGIRIGATGPYLVPLAPVELQTDPLIAAIADLSGHRAEIDRLLSVRRDELLADATAALQALLTTDAVRMIVRALRIPATGLHFDSIAIDPEGVIAQVAAHVGPWPAADVRVPSIFALPDGRVRLNAHQSWIPGGQIERYRWSELPSGLAFDERGRFTVEAARARSMRRWRLEVSGRQMAESGDLVPVLGSVEFVESAALPQYVVDYLVAQIQRQPVRKALLLSQLVLRVPALPLPPGDAPPNAYVSALIGNYARVPTQAQTLLHLTESAEELRSLFDAIQERGDDPGLLALIVVPRTLIQGAKLEGLAVPKGVIITDDPAGGWRDVMAMKEQALTLVWPPGKAEPLRFDGQLDKETLHDALGPPLEDGYVATGELRAGVGIGQEAPDFALPHPAGRQVMLRRFRGQPVTLYFWSSWSGPSVQGLKAIAAAAEQAGVELITVADGDDRNAVDSVLGQSGLDLTVVADPQREIASTYGINCWPSAIDLDANFLVSRIAYGAEEHSTKTSDSVKQDVQ